MTQMISPEPGDDVPAWMAAMLAMALDPLHVQTTMDGPRGLAVVVPDELAERWLTRGATALAVEEKPTVKRGPGRPPKMQEER